MHFDLIVAGGGAAGFFGAIQAAEMKRGLKILILEKSSKVLSKVRISGGGRCNVTHNNYNPFELARHYPRGEKALKDLFKVYNVQHVIQWFASKGVILKAESDGRMFPATDSSQTIIDCFITQAAKLGIEVATGHTVIKVDQGVRGFKVTSNHLKVYESEKILIAIGGSPNFQSYSWIAELSHVIKPPVASLFTFNDAEKRFKDLMGISVASASVRIEGTKFCQHGPVLITHWGLSGPAIIKLSAWAAEYLAERGYTFTVLVNWTGANTEDQVRTHLLEWKGLKSKQKVVSESVFALPHRLSERLYNLAQIDESRTWSELSLRMINKLVELLIRCPFHIRGKTTFKEEFVTCGGVELSEINLATMESRKAKNLYFAGEVLNIDGETGGFNFQSAWTTSFIAARAIASGPH